MAKPVTASLSQGQNARRFGVGALFVWLCGLASFGLLVAIYLQLSSQVINALPVRRLEFVQDIPLPSALPPQFVPNAENVPQKIDPLGPGVAIHTDSFDFQVLDPRTHMLFMAHTGPSPDTYNQFVPSFDPEKDAQIDGHVLAFDLVQGKVVARINIPQVAGMALAPDLNKVFAADANDNIIYAIDEQTLKAEPIQLDDNENPDAITYDPDDHKVFASDPGTSTPVDHVVPNVDPKNQNISVLNLEDNSVSKINLGHLPLLPSESPDLAKYGFSVGHNRYDPGLRRLYVVTQQLTDQIPVNPATPPAGTGELVAIDPVQQKILARLQLPKTCGTPHGMNIDTEYHIAFIACTDVDPDQKLVQNLLRVDLKTMKVFPDPLQLLADSPDMVVLDRPLHILFVGCGGGISIFDIHGGMLKKLGDYALGKGTHTIMVDEETHYIYLPIPDVGGRPILRIARYNPNGT